MVDREQSSAWTVLTNHGRVLAVIAADPGIRVRDIAASLGITERTVLRIISDLEDSGHLTHDRIGTRNRYEITHPAVPVAGGDLDVEVLAAIVTSVGGR